MAAWESRRERDRLKGIDSGSDPSAFVCGYLREALKGYESE
jgi:hypothetical protein